MRDLCITAVSYRAIRIFEGDLKLTHRMQDGQHGLNGIREDHGFETKAFFSRVTILMKNDPATNQLSARLVGFFHSLHLLDHCAFAGFSRT